ncbi:MAG: hypothetical protein K1Y36_26845 [Blastocatellia bacterium]|nr:hypothetical protein [Blastocatellia bacterium]
MDALNRAFALAFFIHPDRPLACEIAVQALARLEVAATAQDKRLYYTPTGRRAGETEPSAVQRTKVTLSDVHLLQYLVYQVSETCERSQEQNPAAAIRLTETDLLIRFIKHLTALTMKRNSFYVALGLCRLLFSYNTQETLEVYGVVLQNPDRLPDDYYCRSRKKKLLEEMRERFGDFLRVAKGQRGEGRFEPGPTGQVQRDWVERCLHQFTPWETSCPIPPDFDPLVDEVPWLHSPHHDPARFQPVEISRMHALLHPECFWRLTAALNLEVPPERLTLPRIFLPGKGEPPAMPPSDRGTPQPLTPQELGEIHQRLDAQSQRRKAASTGTAWIYIDGMERTEFTLRSQETIHLIVDEAALLEIRSRDETGEIVLATLWLASLETSRLSDRATQSITLEGGQTFCFHIQVERDEWGEITHSEIEIAYQAPVPATGPATRWQSLKNLLWRNMRFSDWDFPTFLTPVLAGGLLLICGTGLVYLWWRANLPVAPVVRYDPPLSPVKPVPPLKPVVPGDKPALLPPPVQPPQPRPRHRNPAAGLDSDLTRNVPPGVTASDWQEVKELYVEPFGEDPTSRALFEEVVTQLKASHRFQVQASHESAAGVLDALVLNTGKPGRFSLTVRFRLVNTAGKTLWTSTLTARRSGQVTEISRRGMEQLLATAARFDKIQPGSDTQP